jgi:segregation and condensation protein B
MERDATRDQRQHSSESSQAAREPGGAAREESLLSAPLSESHLQGAEAPAECAAEAEFAREDPGAQDPAVPEGGTLLGAVEAILLVANEPLELKDFTKLFAGCSWVPVRQALRALQKRYDCSESGLELIEVAKGWRLYTKPVYSDLTEKVSVIEREERLTRAQLEVLSVIAYQQPVKRADLEAIRGADSSGSLRALLDKGLARVAGRADQLGRPLLYGTTRRFLERFGLKNLDQLPKPRDV